MKTLVALFCVSCAATSHPAEKARLGASSSFAQMEALLDVPGPVVLESVTSADWEVPLSGLLNIERAGVADRAEPIQIFVHVLRHPTAGTFLVDSGVERDQRTLPWWMKLAIGKDKLKVKRDAAVLRAELGPIAGIFLTHVHLDHVMGLRDFDTKTPLYSGPGDAAERSFEHALTQGVFNDFLKGYGPIREWQYDAEGVLDVFGDGSVFAIHAPGHTPGMTAFVVRTPEGAVLLTGDACHTRFGWDNDIEPGTFSSDQQMSRASLQRLKTLAFRHPAMRVHAGHQP
jgi:N-acyl homoserine lactone hydrolase